MIRTINKVKHKSFKDEYLHTSEEARTQKSMHIRHTKTLPFYPLSFSSVIYHVYSITYNYKCMHP